MTNWLLSPECGRMGGSHRGCPTYSRINPEAGGLVALCRCACHQDAVSPQGVRGRERAARIRADWRSGLFRLSDLARRYGITTGGVRLTLRYRPKRKEA